MMATSRAPIITYIKGDNPTNLLATLKAPMTSKFNEYVTYILANMPPSAKDDYTFYYGVTGRAVLFLKLWANTADPVQRKNYLASAQE